MPTNRLKSLPPRQELTIALSSHVIPRQHPSEKLFRYLKCFHSERFADMNASCGSIMNSAVFRSYLVWIELMPRELTETCNHSLMFLVFLTLSCIYVQDGRAEISLYVGARASEHDAMFFVIDSVENFKNATGNGHVDLFKSATVGHGHGESYVHAYEHFYGEDTGGHSGYATVRASATATGTQRYSSIEGVRYYRGTASGRGEIFHHTEVVKTPA